MKRRTARKSNGKTLGITLRQLRVARNLSLVEVSDAIGLSKTHLWELEVGQSANPTLDILRSLASYYGVSVGALIGEQVESGKWDAEEETLINTFRQLPRDQRKVMLSVSTALLCQSQHA